MFIHSQILECSPLTFLREQANRATMTETTALSPPRSVFDAWDSPRHGSTITKDLMAFVLWRHNNQSNKELDFSCTNACDDNDETEMPTQFSTPKRPSPLNFSALHWFNIHWWIVVLGWLIRAYSGRNWLPLSKIKSTFCVILLVQKKCTLLQVFGTSYLQKPWF